MMLVISAGNPTFTEINPVLNLAAMHTIETTIPETLYDITMSVGTNGTAVAAKAEAKPGETVALTITPASGYVVDTITVGVLPLATSATSFVMPATDVTVAVTFKTSA